MREHLAVIQPLCVLKSSLNDCSGSADAIEKELSPVD